MSDIFRFGAVLVESLTRKQSSLYSSDNIDNLVSHFISLLIEGGFADIHPQVMEEEDGEVEEVVALAALCTKLNGKNQPTIRDMR